MGRKKQKRFELFKDMPNCQEIKWDKSNQYNVELLNNLDEYDKIILEIGCGKGEYTVSLAQLNPKNFYIGIDIKSERLYVGAQKCVNEKIENAFFIRASADYIDDIFKESYIDEIWITFPDPRSKKGEQKKRLTHKKYLDKYYKLLKSDSKLHLKTDNRPFFDYSVESINNFPGFEVVENISQKEQLYLSNPLLTNIKTTFEDKFSKKGFAINYLMSKKI